MKFPQDLLEVDGKGKVSCSQPGDLDGGGWGKPLNDSLLNGSELWRGLAAAPPGRGNVSDSGRVGGSRRIFQWPWGQAERLG